MSAQPEAKQVPLVERLEAVPADARLAVNDGPFSTSFYPVGAMAHEAAAELRCLHSVNAELLEALRYCVGVLEQVDCSTGVCCCGSDMQNHGMDDGHLPVDQGQYAQSGAIENALAAIARAEEAKP